MSATLYPVHLVFVLVRRTPGPRNDNDAFKILGVYSNEDQVRAKAGELNGVGADLRDYFFYYARCAFIDPRQT